VSNPDFASISLSRLIHSAGFSDFGTGGVVSFKQELPRLVLVLALMGGLIGIYSGSSFTLNILASAFLFAGLSLSWNIIGGFGGQFSLGHSVFFATGAYVTAWLYLGHGLSPWFGIFAGGIFAACLGVAVSWPVFRLRGPFFAIATMALTEVALSLAMYFENVTGGARGISVPFKRGFGNMIFADRMSYALLMLGFMAAVLVLTAFIARSRLGYELRAVRDNEDTAEASGIDVLRTKLVGMAISAATMAVGGGLYLMYVRVVDPPSLFSLFDVGVKVALIALIGGIGTIYGPLFGALLVIPLESMLRATLGGTIPGSNLVVLGCILVLTALYLRTGIMGALALLGQRFWKEPMR
jgi:branched-chain amino acid transport system permease protein